MIEYRSEPDSDLVEVVIDGSITAEDIEAIFARIDADLKRHETLRILEVIRSMDGIEAAAIWKDMRLGVPLMSKVSRAAIVADKAWIRQVTDLARPFVSAEIRTFEMAELAQARAWLDGREPPAEGDPPLA